MAEKTPSPHAFNDMIAEIDHGKLHAQLSDLMQRVIRSSQETNKPGSLTLTISVKVERNNLIIVAPKVTTKMPAPSTNGATFYADDDGGLHNEDPRQLPLTNLKPISGGNRN